MIKNLHDNPFDETTIAKLEIFEQYAQAWLPTFIMHGDSKICLFDFFAGTGYDKNGVPGSPIRLLQKIEEQSAIIAEKNMKIKVFFNEYDRLKFEQLKSACEDFLEEHKTVKNVIEITIVNEDFAECFPKQIPTIRSYSSLVYLDQNGIRFLASEYLSELEKTIRTDFLYFVSSSYFWRFGNEEEFKAYVDIDLNIARQEPYKFIHRSLIAQLKLKISPSNKLKLYPFSLKKGANIYGIIFGASHPRAIDKFLTIAWKKNETNGEANFDIDDDKKKDQLNLFGDTPLKKIPAFQQRLREKILRGEITNNFQAYNYALEEGHIGSHAADEIKKMKTSKLIDYEGVSPLVTYENVYTKQKMVLYKLIKK